MFSRLETTFFRTVSLTYDQILHRYHGNPVSEILPNLYLSCIPTKESCLGKSYANTDEKIIEFVKKRNPKAPLKLVASIVEEDESKGHGFLGMTMVQKNDWEERKIEQIVLPMVDRTANVNNNAVIDLIRKMKECIDKGNSVLVHCKAGHGRSAMIIDIYKAAHEINPNTKKLYTIPEAYEFIKSQRNEVNLSKEKLLKAIEIVKLIRPMTKEEEAASILYAKKSSHCSYNKFFKVAIPIASTVALTGTIAARMMNN